LGEKDYERLYPIYRASIDFCKLAEIPFTVKIDSGDYETAIQFKDTDDGVFATHPPFSEDWRSNPEIICPDILILFGTEIIGVIEFEEETGPRKTGAHMARKGHGHEGDIDTKRDTRRNDYYTNAKIHCLRIWESNERWRLELFEFLIKTWNQSTPE